MATDSDKVKGVNVNAGNKPCLCHVPTTVNMIVVQAGITPVVFLPVNPNRYAVLIGCSSAQGFEIGWIPGLLGVVQQMRIASGSQALWLSHSDIGDALNMEMWVVADGATKVCAWDFSKTEAYSDANLYGKQSANVGTQRSGGRFNPG